MRVCRVILMKTYGIVESGSHFIATAVRVTVTTVFSFVLFGPRALVSDFVVCSHGRSASKLLPAPPLGLTDIPSRVFMEMISSALSI